jgi:hypothetical protein
MEHGASSHFALQVGVISVVLTADLTGGAKWVGGHALLSAIQISPISFPDAASLPLVSTRRGHQLTDPFRHQATKLSYPSPSLGDPNATLLRPEGVHCNLVASAMPAYHHQASVQVTRGPFHLRGIIVSPSHRTTK